MDFFKIMVPVLVANLLTVTFVYAMVAIHRIDREGTRNYGHYPWLVVLVLGLGAGGMFLNGDMDWLKNRFASRFASSTPRAEPTPPIILEKSQFDALPSGTIFIAPDGSKRIKP